MSQRFQFTIEVAANAAPISTLTTATNAQTAAAKALATTTAATTAAMVQQEQAVKRLSLISLPEPTMVVQQRQMQARKQAAEASAKASREAHATMLRNIEEERQARLKMGAKWQAASRQGGAGGGMAGGAAAGAGGMGNNMALLEASRAIEDAQYGVAGVLNNIPGLVMALGGGAGLAGGLSLAAVAASQLVKHLGGIGGAVDEEALKKKMAAVEGVVNASLDAMSARMQARVESDLAAIQKTVDAKLSAARESMAGLEAGSAAATAAAASKDQSQDAASMAEQVWADAGGGAESKAQTAAVMQERIDAQTAERKRAEDDKAVQEAVWKRQIAEQGVSNVREVIGAGMFGSMSQGRADILKQLRENGTMSDQELAVQQYEQAQQAREAAGTVAAGYEQKLADLGPLGRWTSPLKFMQYSKLAGSARSKAGEQAQLENNLLPAAEQARAQMAAGDVSFEDMKKREANMPTFQRVAFRQGVSDFEAQKEREKQAAANAEKAKAELAQAQKELAAAQQAEQQARAAQQNQELIRQSERVARGELPEVSPEQMGALERGARERGGLGEVPMLPGAVPDLSGAEAGFREAMDRTGTTVQQTMERMVSASEAMVSKLGGALGALEGRLNALEGRLETVKVGGQ